MHEEVWSCLAPWGVGTIGGCHATRDARATRTLGQDAGSSRRRSRVARLLYPFPPRASSIRHSTCLSSSTEGVHRRRLACSSHALVVKSCQSRALLQSTDPVTSVLPSASTSGTSSYAEIASTSKYCINGPVPVVPAVSIPQVVELLCTSDQGRGRGSVRDVGDGSADNY